MVRHSDSRAAFEGPFPRPCLISQKFETRVTDVMRKNKGYMALSHWSEGALL